MNSERLWIISRRIDRINEIIGKSAAHCTIVMVFVTFLVTVLRYGFNIGSIALQESIIYFHGAVFMLAAAYTLRKGAHVRIDLLYHKKTDQQKAKSDIIGTCFFLLPAMIFCFVISLDYVITSWSVLEGSREAGGLDLVFLLKTLLIIMPAMLIMQGIADLIRNSLFIKGKITVEEWK